MDKCLTCLSNSGERRISPGPTIYKGAHWVVEHTYPSALEGWLVIASRRHVVALHDLHPEEWAEFGHILPRTISLLHRVFGSAKEYLMCMAEKPGFEHTHYHVVPRGADWPEEVKGMKSFAWLRNPNPLPREQIASLCERLKEEF